MKGEKPISFALDGANDICKYANNMFVNEHGESVASRIAVDLMTSRNGSPKSLKDVSDIQHRLLQQYNDMLIQKGIGMRRGELRKKDIIDVRNLCQYPAGNTVMGESSRIPIIDYSKIDKNYISETTWFCYIPCFNEGVLQLNSARYIYWKIDKIDVNAKTIDCYIRDYLRESNLWQIGVDAYLHYDLHAYSETANGEKILQDKCAVTKSTLFPELYRQIPYAELKWSNSDIDIWENIVIQYAESMVEKLEKKYHTDNAKELSKIFTYFILLANQELYKNKPKAIRKQKTENQTKRKTEADNSAIQPRKLIRTVGRISMQSEKPPKMPTKETVVHYKTAVWKARGGIRRMKNGKLVPFKESIRHRKCLQNKSDVPQSCIRFSEKK